MQRSLCIKVSLDGDLRRVALDRDTLTFAFLKTSLRTIFPSTPDFTLSYTDDDGDSIAITSDLELAAALLPDPNPLRLLAVPALLPARRETVETELRPRSPFPQAKRCAEMQLAVIPAASSVYHESVERASVPIPRAKRFCAERWLAKVQVEGNAPEQNSSTLRPLPSGSSHVGPGPDRLTVDGLQSVFGKNEEKEDDDIDVIDLEPTTPTDIDVGTSHQTIIPSKGQAESPTSRSLSPSPSGHSPVYSPPYSPTRPTIDASFLASSLPPSRSATNPALPLSRVRLRSPAQRLPRKNWDSEALRIANEMPKPHRADFLCLKKSLKALCDGDLERFPACLMLNLPHKCEAVCKRDRWAYEDFITQRLCRIYPDLNIVRVRALDYESRHVVVIVASRRDLGILIKPGQHNAKVSWQTSSNVWVRSFERLAFVGRMYSSHSYKERVVDLSFLADSETSSAEIVLTDVKDVFNFSGDLYNMLMVISMVGRIGRKGFKYLHTICFASGGMVPLDVQNVLKQ